MFVPLVVLGFGSADVHFPLSLVCVAFEPCPDVVVHGRVRLRAGHWSVTLFLANEQAEDRPRDMYWLFQAELTVRGRFARRPGQGHVSTLDAISRMDLLINEVERDCES